MLAGELANAQVIRNGPKPPLSQKLWGWKPSEQPCAPTSSQAHPIHTQSPGRPWEDTEPLLRPALLWCTQTLPESKTLQM